MTSEFNRRMTVPNAVTAARIALAIVAAWLAIRGAHEVAVALCIVAALLDGFDGWYARAFRQRSRVGEHMDPFADKILMGVVYAWIGVDAASIWVWILIALVAARELAMTVFRSYSLRRHGRYIPASSMGRTKMFVQSVVGLVILGLTHLARVHVPAAFVAACLAVILALSYASAAAYVLDWKRNAARTNDAERARRRAAVGS
jgi:CDP-diacylglycerol--glycerol-3-phosphate 3-phosphatidyltransferase